MKLKIGDLVYLKNVGFPFNKDDEQGESWEGASCIVKELNSGLYNDMITVQPLFPIGKMEDCLFSPDMIRKENRPWLKKNLRKISKYRAKLIGLALEIKDELI